MFVLPLSPSQQHSALRRTLSGCGLVAADDTASTRSPRMDVIESDTGYSVVLDLPGVAKEQLDVTVVGRRVEVSTRPAANGAEDTRRVLYRERGTSAYARTVVLPEEVDNTQSQARIDNGVLTLTLAKRSAAGASKIQVS